MSPLVLHTPEELLQWRRSLAPTKSVGFVPTMGALHQGHLTLLQESRRENDISILSIFVNPTQFNDKADFEKYPSTWTADLALATEAKVDVIWAPTSDLMYPDAYRYKVTEQEFSKQLCGKDRPGHFDGVLTVVMKLLTATRPDRAYFGEKDFQQLTLVREMTKAFFMDCQIVAVPTIREEDGLATSSRNVRLTAEERTIAPWIYAAIRSAPSAEAAKEQLESKSLQVDYVEDRNGRRFAAVRVGEVRLIDNVEI